MSWEAFPQLFAVGIEKNPIFKHLGVFHGANNYKSYYLLSTYFEAATALKLHGEGERPVQPPAASVLLASCPVCCYSFSH